MVYIYTDGSYGTHIPNLENNTIIAGMTYYILHIDSHYNEIISQEYYSIKYTKEELEMLCSYNGIGEILKQCNDSCIVEFLAIYNALERISHINDTVTLFTDYKGYMDVLDRFKKTGDFKKPYSQSSIVMDFFNKNYDLSKIQFNYTKGHCKTEPLQHKLCDYFSSYNDRKRLICDDGNVIIGKEKSSKRGNKTWDKLNIFTDEGIKLIKEELGIK